jgi:Secretion system C-terminal sorting domain
LRTAKTDAATVNLHWESKIVNGIAENRLSHLKVQPNPFYDYIQITGLTTDANYEVSDASGRTLISGMVNADGIVDLHALNNGFYILKISQNDRVHVTHKIIKLK